MSFPLEVGDSCELAMTRLSKGVQLSLHAGRGCMKGCRTSSSGGKCINPEAHNGELLLTILILASEIVATCFAVGFHGSGASGLPLGIVFRLSKTVCCQLAPTEI